MDNRITIHPDICNGRPVIAGTRILVQTVRGFLAAGDSIEAVLEDYPTLTREDIDACMQFTNSESLGWLPGLLERTAGSSPDDPLSRSPQGDLQARGPFDHDRNV